MTTEKNPTLENNSDEAQRPYQVMVFVGGLGEVPPPVEGVRFVDLTPSADPTDGEHPMIARLRESGVTPADLRSKVLLLLSPQADARSAVLAYTVTTGFAARRVDVAQGALCVDIEKIDKVFRVTDDRPRPSSPADLIQIGGEHSVIPVVSAESLTTAAHAERVRWARRARLTLSSSPVESVVSLASVAALRARGPVERFPHLVNGDEPDVVDVNDEEQTFSGVDLDALRRQAQEMRQGMKFEDRSALAEPAPVTSRQQELLRAALTPAPDVMLALGATSPDGNLWHCPRPGRHRNGDANASMRVDDDNVRCFRCDPERVDVVRLVADVKEISFDEAAAWILNITPAS